MFHVTHEVSCRCCGGELRTVLDLGAICPSNFVEGNEEVPGVSLTLAQCTTCGLVQLHDTVELDAMYRQYWYKSSLNASMVKALNDVVTRATEHVELVDGDVVVDIGANDGTLLAMYPERLLRVGFDPALNLAKEATGKCDCFVNDYFTADSYPIPERAKIITSIAMFYDLPSPHRFVEDITKILHPEGIWVVQFTDLVSMLKINAFDNICHEHLEYYSLHVVKDIIEMHGLELIDVEYNTVNGGSLRAYIAFAGAKEVSENVAVFLKEEHEYLGMFEDPLVAFAARVERIKTEVLGYLEKAKADGRSIFVLGASTKGNTLLQYFGLDVHTIAYAAEVNPDKFGLKTVGTHIPIIPQVQALALKPDVFLVLPWHFIDTFRESLKMYLEGGGILYVPLPEPGECK